MCAAYVNDRRPRSLLLVILSPLYLWLGAMSSVPHKEERFAYVVYPQVRGVLHCPNAAPHLTAPRHAGMPVSGSGS